MARKPSLTLTKTTACKLFLLPLSFGFCASQSIAQQNSVTDRLKEDNAATLIEGETISGRPDHEIRIKKQVEITRGSTIVNADDMVYDIVDDRVDADGNVEIRRSGDRFTGKLLKLKLDTGVGYLNSVVYRLLRRNAQGSAEKINFESEDSATITNGVYTTCNGPDPDWYLRTGRLTLDEGAAIGEARNAVLVFKGVPVMGMPSVSFPLDDGRKSGFLAPTLTTSTATGLQVTTPYFWNIAPNRDLTLFPRYFSNRGLMLGADARYLERDFAGETRLEFMNDTKFDGSTRYAFSTNHNQMISQDTRFTLDYNKASDDFYSRDFPLSHVFDRPGVNRRLLPQTATVLYSPGGPWSGTFQLSDFQLLQDPNAPIRQPYARLPQINLSYNEYSDRGFALSVPSQYTNFSHPTAVQGDRFIVNPRLTYTDLQGPGYFVRPSFSTHGTFYNLNQISDPLMTAPARLVPTVSLDSGLIFERETQFFGKSSTQTLEPRVFYAYTPYVAQNGGLYPNFDTTIADLSYGMMFRENRFIGNDRISDANQVTLAMTSRYLEDGGMERLRLAIAQRFNLKQSKVGLGNDLAINTEEKTDIMLLGTGRITRETRIDANIQYNQDRSEVNRVNTGVYWQPEPYKVLNVQYRRDSRNLADIPNTKYELFDLSSQWPIGNRWSGVGRINYLLDERRIGQSLLGLEHQSDCWAFRVVGQFMPTAAGVTNTTIFVQLEFNGLSTLGTNPMRALRMNIPGYQSFSQSPMPMQ